MIKYDNKGRYLKEKLEKKNFSQTENLSITI